MNLNLWCKEGEYLEAWSPSGKDSTRKSSDTRKRTLLSVNFSGTVLEREEDETEQPPLTAIVIFGAQVRT